MHAAIALDVYVLYLSIGLCCRLRMNSYLYCYYVYSALIQLAVTKTNYYGLNWMHKLFILLLDSVAQLEGSLSAKDLFSISLCHFALTSIELNAT